jgi:hypothetical protein
MIVDDHNFSLSFGRGTRIEREEPLVIRLDPDKDHVYPRVKIVQVIRVSCIVSIDGDTCAWCDAETPSLQMSGQESVEHVLAHHDGERIVFPCPPEDVEDSPDRDQYLVPGWQTIGDEMVCGDCVAEAKKAAKKVKANRRGKGAR